MMAKDQKTSNYDASQIKILGGIEAVRKRPSMYIGSTSKSGLHHLVYEVIDNSIDEALAGFCTDIDVIMNKDNSITVADNGRGIPIDMHKEAKRPAAEVVLTTLHAGGKFGKGVYKVSGGLHGVGVSCVNALSEWMEVEIQRDGKIYRQHFDRGIPKPERLEKDKSTGGKTGTKVTFLADKEIFNEVNEINYDRETLTHRIRELAYLNKGIKIRFIDDRGKEEIFKFDGGIVSYVKHLIEGKDALYSPPMFFSGDEGDTFVEVCMQHSKDYYDENIISFVNCIKTKEGGTHEVGFKTAITRSVNNYARKHEITKGENLTGDDVREGLTAVLSLRLSNPQFEGQTKTKLGNSEVKGIVDSIVDRGISDYLEKNPSAARTIVDKSLIAFRVRAAARKAQDLERKKSALETTTLPGKLADCSERDAAKCEIFIVEGDSAGGSAKQGRNRDFQAILPLRGKILNVEKARLDKILNSEEIRALIMAIGPGVISGLKGDSSGGEKDELSKEEMLDKLRYHKIIVMTDADVDGSHIRTLLLTFFYRYARSLIDNGNLYIAQPPLYLVKKGRAQHWVYNDAELQKLMKKIGKEGISLQRYKGLGEMNPDQLWDTTMNPETRTMLQVTLDDAEVADEIFKMLMGSQVEPRRAFIEEYANKVRWLDV